MARLIIGIDAQLGNAERMAEAERLFGIEIRLGVGMGPTTLTIRPAKDEQPLSLQTIVAALAKLLGLDALDAFKKLGESKTWGKVFKVAILPELAVILAPEASSVQARFKLFYKGRYGITFSEVLPSWLTVEPDITIYDLIIGYWQEQGGLDLRARIHIPDQNPSLVVAQLGADPPEGKTEVVDYPFPLPGEGGSLFRLDYAGLGQHFGPTADLSAEDPIEKIFDDLQKNLVSNDPKTLLRELVQKYYHPDRNWFFGANIYLKGWRVQLIFNDPALYGLRITCDSDKFKGFKFEILYQKLGPDLGVFYGAISIPEQYRQINLGAVALTLPSFEIWIYTNGDFKVSVGWPLGPNSIGFEIYIFIGGCAFYFAKLRSGLNPQEPDPPVSYNPILALGLAIKIGLGRSIHKGVFSAELSLTLQGVFQGIVAWQDEQARLLPGSRALTAAGSISRAPDYFWFSATVGIVGLLQGSVDLKIIKVTVSIRLSVTAGIAFETDYGTVARVTASVKVQAKVKVVFVTIKASFSLTLTENFVLSNGRHGPASIDGPRNPSFRGIPPQIAARSFALGGRPCPAFLRSDLQRDVQAQDLRVHMLLFPGAVYSGEAGASQAVAVPMLDAPAADPENPPTDYDRLLISLARWLLAEYGGTEPLWHDVVEALGQGGSPPPPGFTEQLFDFLGEAFRFVLQGVDLSADLPEADLTVLPMFQALRMTVTGGEEPIDFDATKTPIDYGEVIAKYFAELTLGLLMSNPEEPPELDRLALAPDGPSMAQLMFVDYFLMIARDMARRLADYEEENAGDIAAPRSLEEEVRSIAVEVANMASRTLLNGLILPDPKDVNPDPKKVDLQDLPLRGLYVLTRQQFAVDLSQPITEAVFSLADPDAPLASAIRFTAEDGEEPGTTTARIPVAAAPPVPAPVWRDGPAALAGADITVAPLAAVSSSRRWFATRENEVWEQPNDTRSYVLFPPSELLSLAREAPLSLTVRTKPPQEPDLSVHEAEARPALFIQFRVRRVTRQLDSNVEESGESVPDYLERIYEITTTQDDTRQRIGRLLRSEQLGEIELSVLTNKAGGGYRSETLDLDSQPVFLIKTNLSTVSQPESLETSLLLRAALTEEDLGPTFGSLDDPAAFLRLIWENSIVNAAGFYLRYADADGEGLPDDLFGESDSADLAILARPSRDRRLHDFSNALVLPGDVADAVFISAAMPDGTFAQEHQPAYPPGCVGFHIDWRDAAALRLAADDDARPPPYGEDTIAALYDLIQFRISGDTAGGPRFESSLWSAPLGRSDDRNLGAGPSEEPGSYRQVVPVYRFVKGGSKNVYDAVGGEPQLQFRILDTYGNALDDESHRRAFSALYHDPLISLGEWPGIRAAYRVAEDGTAGPAVILGLEFDPESIVRPDPEDLMAVAGVSQPTAIDKGHQQAKIAHYRYRFVIDQLHDPNTEAHLFSSLFGERAPLDEGPGLRNDLADAATEISDQLQRYLDSGDPAELKPKRWAFAVQIDPARMTQRDSNIFAIVFDVELRRKGLVDPEAESKIPASRQTAWILPPELNQRAANGRAEDAPEEVDLRAFAADFEKVFEGFDGAEGRLKLAVRMGEADFSATGEHAYIWGVRWSKDHGLHIAFRDGEAAYFAPTPLSNKLQGGDVPVVVYDEQLDGKEEHRSFSAIDLDVWARGYLKALDNSLSPAVAAAIAEVSAADYDSLLKIKELLAAAIKRGVAPVFRDDEAIKRGDLKFGLNQLIEGDLDTARDRFEQSVLTHLSTAYETAVILQTAADITTAEASLPAEKTAPRLFGGAVRPENDLAADPPESSFSVSNAKLILQPPAPKRPRFPTFLVRAANPDERTHIDTELSYRPGFIEHLVDEEDTAYGYRPSTWLRLVETGPKSPFDFALGNFRLPLPTISYPTDPVLFLQEAKQAASEATLLGAGTGDPGQRFGWNYKAVVRKTEANTKDVLHTRLFFNERIDGLAQKRRKRVALREPGEMSGPGDITGLFQALARFVVAWDRLEPMVASLPTRVAKPEGKGPAPEKIVALLLEVARAVAEHWAAFRGVTGADGQALFPLRLLAEDAAPPARRIVPYDVDFQDAGRAKPELIVTSDQNELWPQINGAAPNPPARQPSGTGWQRTYALKAPPDDLPRDALLFEWRNLDALGEQTGRLAAWIVRNSNLSSGDQPPTNPDLVYRTPETTFANPVIPLLSLRGYGPIPAGDSLAGTLYEALGPLLNAGSAAAELRIAKLETGYGFALIRDLRNPDSVIESSSAAILSDDLRIRLGEASGEEEAATPRAIAERLAADLDAWYRVRLPATEEARLVQSLTLFASFNDVQLPVLTLRDIVYEVKPGWWPAATAADDA